MKVLITGIAGFVGEYLATELLNHGYEVFGTKRKKSHYSGKIKNIYDMDLENSEEIQKIIDTVRPEQVYHLAGQSSVALSWKNPSLTLKTNTLGTLNILNAIKKTNINPRILLIGSSDMYGIVKPSECPINENQTINPQNPYATSKRAQEELALQYIKAFDLDIVLARTFNHIGEEQRKGFVVADFASQIAEIEKKKIKPVMYTGNLEASRSFTDVKDVVIAYRLLLEKGKKGEVYNIGSDSSYKMKEILDKLLSFSTEKIEVKKDEKRMRPSEIPIISCDSSKIKKHCNWKANIPIDTTLKNVLESWRKK